MQRKIDILGEYVTSSSNIVIIALLICLSFINQPDECFKRSFTYHAHDCNLKQIDFVIQRLNYLSHQNGRLIAAGLYQFKCWRQAHSLQLPVMLEKIRIAMGTFSNKPT